MSIKMDSRHLYLQVIDEVKRDIECGKYKEREKLPSEFQLSKQLGVSRATLREALRILEEENVVTRRHGVGTFVNPKPIYSSGIEQLNSVTYMIKQAGKTPGSEYISTETIEPTEDDRSRFSSKEIRKLAKIERVRTADNEPVVFCIDKIPEGLIPLDHVHEEDSLFKLMEDYAGKRITYAVTYIEPISYHDRIYDILNCDPEQSLLLLKQVHYTAEDEPVLYSVNYFRSDIFSFYVLRKRL
ncbi:UTRA domain-containing protein [Virgibacillus dakarensis]|uniref:HTH-type transcriptional regulator YmfC n=1 Tax=Lentibacillus populi TaxID=1827502 RepID=A0A9W5TUY2_9BACI|nr:MULTISPECIES: GntR family transcriptional regulator [Bacillaceae]MTW84923.1 UTRA domain-containing protein [Virgibacillus dakarensis]GGB30778.1 putative HTH-type transcriptional regulator YmfC [Lentibacillus populi]